jgi:hypothetical protein
MNYIKNICHEGTKAHRIHKDCHKTNIQYFKYTLSICETLDNQSKKLKSHSSIHFR